MSEKLFPNQNPDENVLHIYRRHWVFYVPSFIFALASALILFAVFYIVLKYVAGQTLGLQIATVGISVGLLLVIALMFYSFVDNYLDIFVITDERLIDIKQHGLFNHATNEIHMLDIENVTANTSGILGAYFKCGDLIVKTAEEGENILVTGIPDVARVARSITDLHATYLRGRAETHQYPNE